jgi:hypothetical protein
MDFISDTGDTTSSYPAKRRKVYVGIQDTGDTTSSCPAKRGIILWIRSALRYMTDITNEKVREQKTTLKRANTEDKSNPEKGIC